MLIRSELIPEIVFRTCLQIPWRHLTFFKLCDLLKFVVIDDAAQIMCFWDLNFIRAAIRIFVHQVQLETIFVDDPVERLVVDYFGVRSA